MKCPYCHSEIPDGKLIDEKSLSPRREVDLSEKIRAISDKYLPKTRRPISSVHTVAAEMFAVKKDTTVEIFLPDDWVMGTGFLIQGRLIATNAHVIMTRADGTPRILTGLRARHRGKFYPIQVVNLDVNEDVAVLKFTHEYPADIDVLANRLGNSHALLPGDEVITVGSALGYGLSYNKFSIKDYVKHHTEIEYSRFREIILMNGTAQHGNSGGPLYNINGEVVGLLTGSPNTPEDVLLEYPDKTVSAVLLSTEPGICFGVTSETLRDLL